MPKQQKTRKRKGKDVDEIQDDLKSGRLETEKDPDLPGGGHFYCPQCSRHFVSALVLEAHRNTKLHKRQLKRLSEKQYTMAEAEAAGGVGSYTEPMGRNVGDNRIVIDS